MKQVNGTHNVIDGSATFNVTVFHFINKDTEIVEQSNELLNLYIVFTMEQRERNILFKKEQVSFIIERKILNNMWLELFLWE